MKLCNVTFSFEKIQCVTVTFNNILADFNEQFKEPLYD